MSHQWKQAEYRWVWKHWYKLYPQLDILQDTSYKDLYPKLELFHCFFFLGPLQIKFYASNSWFRTREYSASMKKFLLEDLQSVKYTKQTPDQGE